MFPKSTARIGCATKAKPPLGDGGKATAADGGPYTS
jgi:hypothetical protein